MRIVDAEGAIFLRWRPMISICLITKNEQRNLEECLKNIRSLGSEIIVVDTGSSDRTIEIAKDCGARTFEFEWINDFSAARNFAISKATNPWIFQIDPDERVDEAHFDSIRRLTESQELAYYITVRNYLRNESDLSSIPCRGEFSHFEKDAKAYFTNRSVRLFKNDPSLKYVGRVHETIRYSLPDAYVIPQPAEICIHHYGTLASQERVQEKKNQYLEMAKLESFESPNYWFAQFCIGRAAIYRGDLDVARSALENAAKVYPSNSAVQNNLALVYMRTGEMKRAVTALQQSLSGEVEMPEAWLNLGLISMESGQWSQALPLIDRALKIRPHYYEGMRSRAQCLAQLGRVSESEAQFQAAIQAYPQAADGHVDLAALLIQTGRSKLGLEMLQQIVVRFPNDERARAFLMKHHQPGLILQSNASESDFVLPSS